MRWAHIIVSLLALAFLIHPLSGIKTKDSQTMWENKTLCRESDANNHCDGCNIVLITIDALRADHLGAYGYPRNTSPNIDALATRSVLFERAFTVWPQTSESIASMMSSRYPGQTGVTDLHMPIPVDEEMMAEILRDHGYKTAGFVTNGNIGRDYNFDQGFDEFYEIWKTPVMGLKNGSNRTPTNELLIPWLEQRARNKFFLWVHYIDPHAPYAPAPPHDRQFVNDRYYAPNQRINSSLIPAKVLLENASEVDPEFYVAQYDGEVRTADDEVGELISVLSERGFMNDTVIMISADHGENMWDSKGYFGHGDYVTNSVIHIPLLISMPGGCGLNVQEPVSNIDYTPTILDLVGIDISNYSFEGRSLAPLALGGSAPKRILFGQNSDTYYLIDGDYKLIWKINSSDGKLYNITADPLESTPLSGPDEDKFIISEKENMLKIQVRSGKARMNDNPPDDRTLDQLKSLGYAG
jgi:arylsulfatase A-like enzyme